MSVFKNILVPVDGSEHSSRAIEYASQIASKFNSKLTLFHAYYFTLPITSSPVFPDAPNYGAMTQESIDVLSQKAKKYANQILVQATNLVKGKNVVVKSLLREGRVVPEILKVLETEKVDLIVMGARGISGIKKLLLGSTSEAVVKKANCPVLIVK